MSSSCEGQIFNHYTIIKLWCFLSLPFIILLFKRIFYPLYCFLGQGLTLLVLTTVSSPSPNVLHIIKSVPLYCMRTDHRFITRTANVLQAAKHEHTIFVVVSVSKTCRTWTHASDMDTCPTCVKHSLTTSDKSQLGWLAGHGQTESGHGANTVTQLSDTERLRESNPTRLSSNLTCYLYTLNAQFWSQINLSLSHIPNRSCRQPRGSGSSFSWSICSL